LLNINRFAFAASLPLAAAKKFVISLLKPVGVAYGGGIAVDVGLGPEAFTVIFLRSSTKI